MAAFDAGTSVAKRRRERRLRSWWRHERMSIAALLAAVSHHSYPKVDTKNDASRGQKTVTSTIVAPAECYELSSDDGRPTGGERPATLFEPWPQEQVQRHAGIGYELFQALEAPVLQMVEQLAGCSPFLRHVSAGCCRAGYRRAQDHPRERLSHDAYVVSRSWRNSWWKCRRFSTSSSSGFPSRSSTIQFRMVVVELMEVFKAFTTGHFPVPLLWSRTLRFHLSSGVRRLQGFLPEQSATAFGEADHRFPAAICGADRRHSLFLVQELQDSTPRTEFMPQSCTLSS